MYMSEFCCYVMLNFWRRSSAIYPWNPEELGTRDWPSRNWNRRSLWVAAPKSLVHVEYEKLLENYLGAQGTFNSMSVRVHWCRTNSFIVPRDARRALELLTDVHMRNADAAAALSTASRAESTSGSGSAVTVSSLRLAHLVSLQGKEREAAVKYRQVTAYTHTNLYINRSIWK